MAIDEFHTLLLQLLPRHKKTSTGWRNFNCPVCIHNGQTRPDSRRRGGLFLTPDGGFRYRCFNCKFKCNWMPGLVVSKRCKQLFSWAGATQDQIDRLSLEALKAQQQGIQPIPYRAPTNNLLGPALPTDGESQGPVVLPHLPPNTFTLATWALEKTPPNAFIKILEYIGNRDPHLLDYGDSIYWSTEVPERFIFPLKYQGYMYGYSGRIAQDGKKDTVKYLNQPEGQTKFLYNADALYKPWRKYVLVFEGIIDALYADGIALMGNEITPVQLNWLRSTDKQVILVPDRDRPGLQLIDYVKNNCPDWMISLPPWPEGCKDYADATKVLGKSFALKLIFDFAYQDTLIINMRAKTWLEA